MTISQFIKAGVLIQRDNKFLLVQEKARRAHGLWNFPSGKVEDGTTIEQTAIREAKEETGFDVSLQKKVSILTETFQDTKELHIFLAKITGGLLQIPEDEILDAQWFSLDEIENMKDKLVGIWIVEAVYEVLG